MEDCVFCKIINRELPGTILYEDDEIMAFRDIQPAAPIHVLVIPKKHISSLVDLTPEDERIIGRIYSVINKVAKMEGILDKGYRVVVNCGEDGGQVVKHIHFHLLGGRHMGLKVC